MRLRKTSSRKQIWSGENRDQTLAVTWESGYLVVLLSRESQLSVFQVNEYCFCEEGITQGWLLELEKLKEDQTGHDAIDADDGIDLTHLEVYPIVVDEADECTGDEVEMLHDVSFFPKRCFWFVDVYKLSTEKSKYLGGKLSHIILII
ncbi:Uncharacterized protein Adt_39579 [Abeliophyllum distichum]|uniref:Uncharacterized protein n=1 Tax=Abeliophyllum distichum TaxID=126358 RepID=A0ABD1Q764_9LAMI